MVSRKVGALNKMVLSALKGKKGVKWSHVMSYLEKNSLASDSREETMAFDSPFPSYQKPDDDLRRELWHDSRGDSVLRLALKGAPSRIIAALCHFCPESLASADINGRLPLHAACRYSVSDVGDKILQILVRAYPAALIARDSCGRTPLHYLFWYHAPERSPEMVHLFCQKLPKSSFFKIKQDHSGDRRYPLPEIPRPASTAKIPATAAIVMDGKHGCLPIHYAVMQGANPSSVEALLQAYPAAKHEGDRYGRTALHWYLGAEMLKKQPTHVSGEMMPPEYSNWWEKALENSLLEQLASSRVVRTADSLGRFPLHWACHLIARNLFHFRNRQLHEIKQVLSVEALKLIADPHVGQIGQIDSESKTPIMVLLDTFGKLQREYWEEYHSVGMPLDLYVGGPPGFDPPPGLVNLLIKHPDETSTVHPAEIEDTSGRLPIHAALEIAAADDIIEALIETNPACLVHTSEETFSSPLHAAFRYEYTAPFHTTNTIGILLNSYNAGRHGYHLDGRLAMKMEDGEGNYPIHLACSNKACLDVIRLLVEKYPKTALLQKSDFDLPLHTVLEEEIVSYLVSPYDSTQPPSNFEERLHVLRAKIRVLAGPLTTDASKLQVTGRKMGMLPLHVVVLFQALDYSSISRMLGLYPESGLIFTADTVHSLSVLDMHELALALWNGSDDDWQRIRELIFSFGPTLESHRHREELLDSCVRIVIHEMSGIGSYHLNMVDANEDDPPELGITQSLSSLDESSIPFPGVKPARVMRELRPATVKERLQRFQKEKRPPPPPPPLPQQTQSMYDEDDVRLFDYDPTFSGSVGDDEDSADSYSSEDCSNDASSSSASSTSSSSSGSSEGSFTEQDLSSTEDGTMSGSGLSSTIGQSSFTSDGSTLEGATTFETRSSGIRTLQSINEIGSLTSPVQSKSSLQTVEQVFDKAKRLAEEEKKDDERAESQTPTLSNMRELSSPAPQNPSRKSMSEVGMRLWTFFVLYCDRNNPGDNYVRQVGDIFDEIGFSMVEKLVAIPLPSYSALYLKDTMDQKEWEKLSFEEVASPKCRELIRKTCYFVSRFEFRQDDALINWSSDRNTIVVQATDWTFTTEEMKNAANPGVSEAEIWSTGEVPAKVGTTFRSKKTLVWMKLSKDRVAYEREVFINSKLVNTKAAKCILPIVCHYNASSTRRKEDRCYKVDCNDERFRNLRLFKDKKPTGVRSISLADYPYAIVYQAPSFGSLASFHQNYGVESLADIRSTCKQIASAVRMLHEFNVCHGNLTLETIVVSNPDKDKDPSCQQEWVISDLHAGFLTTEPSCHIGRIGYDGKPLYASQTLPPEAFVSLSPPELKAYNIYWQEVARICGSSIDETASSTIPDAEKGTPCVVKNYFEPFASHSKANLPSLPYEPVPMSAAGDLWAFGLILFELCSGKTLSSTNRRSKKLLDAGAFVRWDSDFVHSAVYGEIEDPLAQDLLLQLLSDHESRNKLDFDKVLSHPFLNGPSTDAAKSLALKRKTDATAFQRNRQRLLTDTSDRTWLKDITTPAVVWDFDILAKFYHSPTETTREMGFGDKKNFGVPCSFLVLPFKFTANDKNHLSVATKFGEILLKVSKACIFAGQIKETLKSGQKKKWSTSELLDMVHLPKEGFEELQETLVETASKHVETFRENPMLIAMKTVQSCIEDLFSVFDEKSAWLYLIDEFTGSLFNASSPFAVPTSRKQEVLERSVLGMQLTSLYSRGLSQGIDGIAKLLFNDPAAAIPSSWEAKGAGLRHELTRADYIFELDILQQSLNAMHESKHTIGDDLSYIERLLVDLDSSMRLCNIRRAEVSGMCLWLSKESLIKLIDAAGNVQLGTLLKKHEQGPE